MHEVAIAQGILDIALDVADGQTVRAVRVTAGEMQAVTQDSLQFCFQMVAQETLAAEARLEVRVVGGDTLLVDGVELDDGWHYRPGVASEAPEAPEAPEAAPAT